MEVISLELVPLDYPTRFETLLEHGVGLWDVAQALAGTPAIAGGVCNQDMIRMKLILLERRKCSLIRG